MADTELIFHDGTTMDNCSAGNAGHFLWLYLKGCTMREAFDLAFDTEKISEIGFRYGGLKDVYSGFTQVEAVLKQEDQINVLLTGEHTEKQVETKVPYPVDNETEIPEA